MRITCFPKAALGPPFHRLQQATKRGRWWRAEGAAALAFCPAQCDGRAGAGQQKHEGSGACLAFVRMF